MSAKKKPKEAAPATDPVERAYQATVALAPRLDAVLDWVKVDRLLNEDEYTRCANALVQVKSVLNAAEEERKAITGPLNEVIKRVNGKVKAFTAPRADMEAHLKLLLKRFTDEKRAKLVAAAEVEAKKLERQGAAQMAEDVRTRALTTLPAPTVEGVQTRQLWTFRVVDEKKVPREFLQVDEKKLRGLAGPDAPKVPGVEFFLDTNIAVSA
jgi:hypothetical protein